MSFSTVHSLHEKSWKRASLTPTGKAVKAAKEGNGIRDMPRVSQEKENCWSSQNRISYLQLNSATLPRLIKPFTAVAGEAERVSKTFWLSLAASSRSPGNQPFSVTWSPSPKRKGRGSSSCAIPLLLSIPQALGRLIIDLQNDFSLCSFADTLHRAQTDSSS